MKPTTTQVNQILHQTRAIYNAIADDFSNTRNKWWTGLEKLSDHLQEGGKVLDIGCGYGHLAELFRNKNAKYLGVDNSEELIKIAKNKYSDLPSAVTPPPDRHCEEAWRRGNPGLKSGSPRSSFEDSTSLAMTEKKNDNTKISFSVDDITDLKTTGEFDLIIMIAVLHHLPTEELRIKALQSVYKLLKPGGEFVMYNWHLWSWNYRHRYWKNLLNFKAKKQAGLNSIFDALIPWKPLNKTDMRYVHSFTKHELRRLLKQAGFITEDVYYDTRGKRTNFLFGYNTVVVATKKQQKL